MFRISFLVWLIVLAALNLAVLRSFGYLVADPEPVISLVGLMPLFDTLLVALYFVIAKRFRFAIRKERGAFLETFGVTTAVILALATLISVAAPHRVLQLAEIALDAYQDDLKAFEQRGDNAMPVLGALLGVLMSGPLIALSLLVALILSQFKIVITRREEAAR